MKPSYTRFQFMPLSIFVARLDAFAGAYDYRLFNIASMGADRLKMQFFVYYIAYKKIYS